MGKGKQTVSSGTHWEALAGYSRAVRVGDRILVSGTTATGPDGLVGAGDAGPAGYAIDKIAAASSSWAAGWRTWCARVYVRDIADWEAVAGSTGTLGAIRPANLLVEARWWARSTWLRSRQKQ